MGTLYRASFIFRFIWWRWGESNPRLEDIDLFNSYAIVTWLTTFDCLPGRATNHIQRTDWPSSPKFSSWEYIDSWRFRRYSVPSISSESLNLTRSPARWCVVLVSVYLRLGSDRSSVTIVVSYFLSWFVRWTKPAMKKPPSPIETFTSTW